MTTLHGFGGALGQPLDTFFWALTISWSQLLARVRSGPYTHLEEASWRSAKVSLFRNVLKGPYGGPQILPTTEGLNLHLS